ncbi:MAG: ATP-dependent helicase [Campylobacterota bacterium]
MLNEAQLEASKHIDGPMLILAGAGSGKTKTITARLAYLLSLGIDPADTLTLTFTNKAANEMRQRALDMIDNDSIYPPLLCTFHKFGLMFLKFHIHRLNRKNSFVIIDSDDRKRIVKTIMKNLKIDIPLSFVTTVISNHKNHLIDPALAQEKAEMPNYKKATKIYEAYEQWLQTNNLVDFDDLLVLPYKILRDNDDICEQTSKKYKYIMVDEYQDTNDIQFKLLQKLCSTHDNLCVVGDDDQSIYGWRGANVKNILEFHEHFEGTKIVKLQTNYRSTDQILNVSNQLIEHNRNRLGKTLQSHIGGGEDVRLLESMDENIEANKIAKEVREFILQGEDPQEIAVLYRVNALSRSLEEGLNKEGVPYQLIGGVRFYERAEIKDIICYLRIIANSSDDFSFKRVINKPKRSIGAKTIEKLEFSKGELSFYDFLNESSLKDLEKLTSKKAAKAMKEFIDAVQLCKDEADKAIYNLIDTFESSIKLKEFYTTLPDGRDRILNIDEFYGLFRDSITKNPSISLDEFLHEISLQSDQDQISGEQISIMSIHASKGLEFNRVYVIGCEEEFFPLLGEDCNIEEERRLAYVAMTRAKRHLIMSTADSRFHRGRRKHLKKSRFLKECGLIEGSFTLEESSEYKKGDLVKHKLFGIGRVQEVTKAGKERKLKINFGGNKKEILSSFVESV